MSDLKLCWPIFLVHFAYEAIGELSFPLVSQSLTEGMYLQLTPKKTLRSTELLCLA